MVNLGGIVPLSTVDWLGRAAMVVFLRGCPLRCPHCHNRMLQTGERLVTFHSISSRVVSEVKGLPAASRSGGKSGHLLQIDLDDASERASSKPFVDAIVLSGGEPLQQIEACIRLFRLARGLKLATALETSGCFPEGLESLLAKGLVDRVFLDLKTALSEPDYERATGRPGIAARVAESLEICFKSGAAFEVRCTVFPENPTARQLANIAETICRMKAQYPENRLDYLLLQQGTPREGEARFEPVSVQDLDKMARTCETGCKGKLQVRIRAPPRIAWKN
ncbi:MAG: radical SAM protein [Methanothrix sp.]|nr:radical SAM protein [Methanothrix sp.]